jgi:hypothetical protein
MVLMEYVYGRKFVVSSKMGRISKEAKEGVVEKRTRVQLVESPFSQSSWKDKSGSCET